MARYKYLGEAARPSVVAKMGNTKSISIPKIDGTKTVLEASTPEGFKPGEVINFDFKDPLSLAALDADERFARV